MLHCFALEIKCGRYLPTGYPSLETLEHVADSLQVEMVELFDYSHYDHEAISSSGIESMLTRASTEERRLVYKLIKAALH